MMGKLLQQVLDPANLDQAWRKSQREKTVWLPGISRQSMQNNLLQHLLELIEDVQQGHYRPAPLRRFQVQKANGKQRVLSAFCLRDKLLQRAVLQTLSPYIEPQLHNYSFAYRPGLSVDMALRRCREHISAGLHWLVDADIRECFDNIPHKPLIKSCERYVKEKEILKLLELWLDAGSPKHSLFSIRRGIPQGCITSPLLCNIYLDSFDRNMAKYNIPTVRYADDFLLFTPNKKHAENALEKAQRAMQKLSLELHPDKTQIAKSSPKVHFLGQKLPAVA